MAQQDAFQTTDLLKWQLQQGDVEGVKHIGMQLKSMIDMEGFEYSIYGMEYEFCQELQSLMETATQIHFETARLLLYCRFQLLKRLLEGIDLLEELKKVGFSIRNMAKKLADLRQKQYIVLNYPILEEIMTDMENIDGRGVSSRDRCLRITSVMTDYAHCCNLATDYRKALPLCEEAVQMLQRDIGNNSNKYKVSSYAYYNIGVVHLKISQYADDLLKAKEYFQKALAATGEARDFENDTEKSDLVLLINTKANVVESKLPYQ